MHIFSSPLETNFSSAVHFAPALYHRNHKKKWDIPQMDTPLIQDTSTQCH